MTGRNPDLPILDELGVEFEAMVSAAWTTDDLPAARQTGAAVGPVRGSSAAGSTPATPGPDRHTIRRRAVAPPTRSRERGAQARRIGRRAAIVLVLVCLVGGVAFAALRGGGSEGGDAHTTPALLGRDANGAWSFSVYRDEGRLCTVFVPRGGELSGSCGAAPDHGRLRAGSAIAAGRRYVFGVTGTGVERVQAALAPTDAVGRATKARAAAGVENPIDRGAASDAGFPAGDGWFVVDLGPLHHAGAAAPAVVTPFTKHDHQIGPAYVDCSLGVLSPACKRRIESAARG
jgi:hypothetical protein